jgi:hypothetical protein
MVPGTLHGSLKRMLEAGLNCEGDQRIDPEVDDEPRVYDETSGADEEAFEAELPTLRRC